MNARTQLLASLITCIIFFSALDGVGRLLNDERVAEWLNCRWAPPLP